MKSAIRKLHPVLAVAANHRCGYCQTQEVVSGIPLTVEHLLPKAQGGNDEEENLWLSCRFCNGHKADQTEALDPKTDQLVPLFNPRRQTWHEHFAWSEGGLKIVGKTATGRATVIGLFLADDPDALLVRSFWIQAGWHPPERPYPHQPFTLRQQVFCTLMRGVDYRLLP